MERCMFLKRHVARGVDKRNGAARKDCRVCTQIMKQLGEIRTTLVADAIEPRKCFGAELIAALCSWFRQKEIECNRGHF